MKRRNHGTVTIRNRRRPKKASRPTARIGNAQADQRLLATLAVSQILAASPALEEVMPAVLKTIGETLGWHVGALWLPDEPKLTLHCSAFWRGPNMKPTKFEQETRAHHLKSGVGLPGRVWSSLKPAWAPNVTNDSNFPRATAATVEGLHAAFAFPILAAGKFLGVMEFFSREIREPETPLMTMFATIGGQIGQFFERRRAETALETKLTEQNLLYHLVQAVNQARALPDIYEVALDAIVQGVACDRAAILFLDENGKMSFKAWRSLSEGYRRAVTVHSPWKPDEPNPQPLFIEDAAQLDEHLRKIVEAEGIGALGFIPITYGDKLLGKFMIYYNRPSPVSPAALRLTQTIASQVAFAVHRRRGQEHLEALVRERTAKLREMIGELQHVSYAITHDMRAPLRAMNAFGTLILDEVSGLPGASPQVLDACRRIVASAARLDRLIRDSLNYTRSVLQELPLRPIELSKLVPGLVESYPNLHSDRARIQIATELPCVLGEESLLTQCFSNLLGNAVKFVAPGTHPEIAIRSEKIGGSARITVQDNGIGIAPQAQHRLFGMFQRLTDGYEGTGIGLAIVRKVVERMGGMVGVESEPGKGSRFWVMLRLADPVNSPCSAPASS
jgi:signal transduction histidine kinase